MKIGVFDSGVGGLSVLKSLLDSNLFSEIIYYGDTARVPYGNKDKGTIVRFSLEALDFFAPHKIDMLIVACNTVSAHALNQMQEIAPFPIIGVVESGVLSLSNKIKNKQSRILIIATKATIESGIYERNLRALGYENIISLQTGLFVPLVEEGIFEGEILEATFRHYFGGNSSLTRPSRELEKSSLDGLQSYLRADFPAQPTNLAQDTRIALANNDNSAESTLPCHSKSYSCHSERSEESKNNPSLRADSQNLRGNPPIKKTQDLQSRLPRSHSLARNDEILDSSLCKCSAQNDNVRAFAESTPDAIILACTHFPLIQNAIKKYFHNKPILIHSGEAIVEFLKQKYALDSANLCKNPKVRFYASADKNALEKTAKLWLKS